MTWEHINFGQTKESLEDSYFAVASGKNQLKPATKLFFLPLQVTWIFHFCILYKHLVYIDTYNI